MNSFEKKQIDEISSALAGITDKLKSMNLSDPPPIVILRKHDRMNYVLNSICDYYDISREVLIKRFRNPRYARRKRIAVKILKDDADLSLKEIAEIFGSANSENSVYYMWKNTTEDLQKNTYGNKELKEEYKEVLKYLGL